MAAKFRRRIRKKKSQNSKIKTIPKFHHRKTRTAARKHISTENR